MVAFYCPPPFMTAGSAPFPIVEGAQTSVVSVQSTSHDVSIPSGIQANDLLLIFASVQASASVSGISGWDDVLTLDYANGTAGVILKVFSRVATGSEGSSATFTTNASRFSSHNSYRISGAGSVNHSEIGGRSNAPNPPLLSPSWGDGNSLWITGAAIRSGAGNVTSAPVNYTNLLNAASADSGNNSVRIASARRELAATTEDPGSFTMSSVQDWVSATIAIQPA